MIANVQVGSILVQKQSPCMIGALALDCEPYFQHWGVVKTLNGFTLDDKIRSAHWNFFFLADEVKAMFLGAIGEAKIREALRRIARKVEHHNFNSLEVTAIVTKRFLGIPYTTIIAHSRHFQQSSQLESFESRKNGQRDTPLG